jgi:PAS domain S-box-containing protein
MLRMYGYDNKDEVLKGNHNDLGAVDEGYTSERGIELIQQSLESGRNTFEWIARKKNGDKFWTEVSLSSININGVDEMIASVRDISERKQAEKKLIESEARFKSIIELAPDAILLGNPAGIIIGANEKASEISGYSYDELIGESIQKLFTEEERKRVPLRYDLLKNGEVVLNDRILTRKDGSTLFVAMNTRMMPDGTYQTFIRDMTEKQKLLDAVQQTDRLNSLGVLAGGIAHDFNNLLSGIFGYIEMARLKSAGDKTVSDYLDKAFTVFNRARDLTQQLLTFSKGGMPVRKTGNIGTLIRDSAAFALSGSDISCEYQIEENLRMCDFDENQIAQVVDNIIINAKQAMPIGGRILISVKNYFLHHKENPLLKSGNYIKISISDTGIGIQPDFLKRIFDPFFTTKQQGNGLGLATCYSIIKKHDGLVEAESAPGKGTTFHIFLPASDKKIVYDSYSLSMEGEGSGKILIMDDEDFIREISREMLKVIGYSTAEAGDGNEALLMLAEAEKKGEPFDAAILDLTIPGGMGGKETLVEIRKLYPDMPLFASSGFSESPVISSPKDFGFTGSIRKPYLKDELAAMLSEYMPKKK